MLQKEQEVEPSLVVVSPNAHCTHSVRSISSSDLFHPFGHLTQPLLEASIVATATPYFPTMHLEQDDSPALSVNSPLRQLVHELAPALDILPISQDEHASLLDAPSKLLLDPGTQLLQEEILDAPVAAE